MSRRRDVASRTARRDGAAGPGRKRIAVIGIDRYRHWPALHNAVRDAAGALALFERLGFERVGAPLLDDAATGAAMQAFVADELTTLGADDSLVVFYAGHGGSRTQELDGKPIRTGYLIPVDAAHGSKVASWIEVDGWLRTIGLLPPKHILVILDACYTGLALSSVSRWRDSGASMAASLATLQARRSRRIITSALDDQVALDSGPVHGHSLFTGCLIEGLGLGGLGGDRAVVTGTELGVYVQQRVRSYPRSQQTPDVGTFDFDQRGEMVIPVQTGAADPAVEADAPGREAAPAAAPATPSGAPASPRGHGATVRRIALGLGGAAAAAVAGAWLGSRDAEPAGAAPPGAAPAEIAAPAGAAPPGAAPVEIAASDPARRGSQARDRDPSSPTAPPQAVADRGGPPPLAARSVAAPDSGSRATPPLDAAPPAATPVAPPASRAARTASAPRGCVHLGTYPVLIQSDPHGAKLYLNGRQCGVLCVTPCTVMLPLSKAKVSTFDALLTLDGYPDTTTSIQLERTRELQRVSLRMAPP